MKRRQDCPVSSIFSKITSGVLAIFLIASLSSCAGKSVDQNDPAALFGEAEDEIKHDQYLLALEKLRSIKNKHPYSKYAAEAQLRIADVYFLQESYAEAAATYDSFRELHPKHEKAAYAMFRTAKSHFNDTPSKIARDLGPAHRALEAYRDFLARYPKDPLVKEAKLDMETIQNLLASKEVYIGDFYAKRSLYQSAADRYKKAIQLYPKTQAANEAQAKLTQAEAQLAHSSQQNKKEEGR